MKSTHQLQSITVPIESSQEQSNFFYRGMLTSSYKEEIKENFRNLKSQSLFSLKQTVKTNQYRFMPAVGTILKVSVFVIAYLIAFI
ncbi:hypothetical protein H2O64_02095 [Kordia sp. YSTF-M3]|uniref:Uncharacterized protein n=1 Tax=Kordia aestuariivivens TaxID=2759037 RepID=A0ABR7Q4F3_9FLAO|nr:hypothetical protein [Kordia aestuariivivens]MBC8753444.1 hypothetical protein [Kordia aestuariivivens]